MSQRSRRGLATWLTSSHTPVFVLDDRRVVLVFNHGCEELTQWTAADIIGKACLFQSEANPDLVTSLTGALCPPDESGLIPWTQHRVVLHRKDGTQLERDIHYFPLFTTSDQPAPHLIGMIVPCTETPAPRSDLHLEVSRHVAHLYKKYGVDRLVAASPEMQRVGAQIALARTCPASVHLTGEKGTGREHIARLIHYSGPFSHKRFLPLRCATASHFELSRTLNRLAETGAVEDIGTIYLDDVLALHGDLQPLVLSQSETPGRRWISSSQTGLDGLAEESFNPLLRMKLTSLTISVPPLRARLADLPLLAQQLLEENNTAQSIQHTEFSAGVLRLFQQHAWLGNVDELAGVISKACERSTTSTIEVGDLPFEFSAGLDARSMRPLPHVLTLDEQLTQFERACIAEALAAARGNKSVAAEQLGIPRAKLYRRLEQLGLNDDDTNDDDATPGITLA